MTATSYMFEKKGKVVFEALEGIGEEAILERAIEAGALDVDIDGEGKATVFTVSSQTTTTAQILTGALGLRVESSEIIWDPREDTKVDIDSAETSDTLRNFIGSSQRC